MEKNLQKRFWEIDFLRGVAIILMILFHLAYNLNYFGRYAIDLNSGFWLYLARASSITFILLVGISLTLSFSRAKKMKIDGKKLYSKYIKRGLKIFSWGLIITAITGIFFREKFIFFGVLHFIGISIILAIPFLRFRYLNLLLGIVFISVGMYLKNIFFDFSWLVWMGLRHEKIVAFDYFPIFPWIGIVLIGIFIGNTLYSDYKRKFKLLDLSNNYIVKLFSFAGKHSLFIYLIHQPILILFLYIFGVADIGYFIL